ncbi:hypothetical protein PInf_025509 [Phytophthora infestans]|nr:hypothetical protein PInf_025509 [Phytophthora infestans]
MVEGAGGYKYVLVITDGMSGFVELIAFAQAPLRHRLREVTRLVQAVMSPTGRTSAPTSEDFDATRGDVEDLNEEADARGADAFEDAREEIRIGFPDDLRFNPSDQATMEQHDQL